MKNYENFLNESVSKLFDTLHNRKDAIEGLLSTGFDINTVDENGNTLLHNTCNWGADINTIKIILNEKDVDINIINKKGTTPLFGLLTSYENEMISLFLDHPELDLSITYRSMGSGGNMMSTYANDQNVKKMLINFKPDLEPIFFERLSTAAIKQLEPIFLDKYSDAYETYKREKNLKKYKI